jgi:hypothetical protein
MDSECLICGEQFPKGSLDLLKHSSDIILRHQISKKQTSTFRYNCSYNCGLFFQKKRHLNLHCQNVCGSKVKAKRISLQYVTSTYDSFITKKRKKDNTDSNEIIVLPVEKKRKLSKNNHNKKDIVNDDHNNGNIRDDGDVSEKVGPVKLEPINPENSLECMVCGKIFPRNTTDIQRDMTGNNQIISYAIYHIICHLAYHMSSIISYDR